MGLNRFSSLAGTLMIYAMVLSESWWSCHGCLDEERSALLRIQSSFNYPFLQSWGKVADCCSWKRVYCNLTTGRVVGLYLPSIREEGLGDLYLNVSLFRPFQELQSLDLSGNFIVGCVENEGFERLSGLDSLVGLYLDDNKFDNSILSSLGGLSSLRTLSLSGNQLKGAISVDGTFQLPIHPHQNLFELDISNNNFESHIPREIGSFFPSLTFLSMSDNHFSGRVPSSFDFLLNLQVLDLSNNNISGTLPYLFNSSNLLHVYLSRNMLQRSLEHAFQKSFELITLDLSHNHLTGSIPKWIGEFSQLSFLLLGYNNLDGSIPSQLCKLNKLMFIDLSHNNFSGHILPCLRFISIIRFIRRGANLYEIDLREPLVIATKSLSYSYPPSILHYMTGMDLSCNSLSGAIPPEIGNLNHIHVLNLSNNHLRGSIPQTLSNLSDVESMDLSNNSLNGEIPPQLLQLHSLAYFSVAHNNLSGKTPEMAAQFSTFNKSSYEGNPLLCGPPLLNSCTKEVPLPPPGPSTDEKEESSGIIDAQVFCVSFVVTYIMVLLGIAAVLYINPDWRRAWFYFIEKSINTCYYFVADNLLKPFRIRVWKPLV